MKIELNFYEKRKYNLSTNKGISDLAEDIMFYCKYRVGGLSWDLERGCKVIEQVLKKILKEKI